MMWTSHATENCSQRLTDEISLIFHTFYWKIQGLILPNLKISTGSDRHDDELWTKSLNHHTASPFNNTRSTQYYHDTTRFSIVVSQYHRSSTIYLRHHLIPNRLITPPDNHHLITTAPDPPPFNYITRPIRFKHDTIRSPTLWTQHHINTIKTRFHHIPHRLITILRDPTSLSPYHHTLHPLITTWPDINHSITISPIPLLFHQDPTRYPTLLLA